MTSKTLSELFISQWQAENPEGRIYRNNTGVCWYMDKYGIQRPVAYGIPAPKIGKKQLNKDKPKGGGGTDYIGFRPEIIIDRNVQKIKTALKGIAVSSVNLNNITKSDFKIEITAEFYEIKTINDRISDAQKRFYKVINNMGGTINIVKELADDKWEIVEWME